MTDRELDELRADLLALALGGGNQGGVLSTWDAARYWLIDERGSGLPDTEYKRSIYLEARSLAYLEAINLTLKGKEPQDSQHDPVQP